MRNSDGVTGGHLFAAVVLDRDAQLETVSAKDRKLCRQFLEQSYLERRVDRPRT